MNDEAELLAQIARALDEVRDDLCGFDAEEMSAAVLPIIRAVQKKAWDQGERDGQERWDAWLKHRVHISRPNPYRTP